MWPPAHDEDEALVDAVRAVTQFSDDYIRKALRAGEKVPNGVGYADFVKIKIAARAYELGRRDGRDGRIGAGSG